MRNVTVKLTKYGRYSCLQHLKESLISRTVIAEDGIRLRRC